MPLPLLDPLSRRGLSLVREGPYAGADVTNARRFGLGVQLIAFPVAVLLSIFFPPTVTIGAAGWAVLAALGVPLTLGAVWTARARGAATFASLLSSAYVAAAGVGLLQWLAGGWSAPYHHLFLPLMLVVALVHPPTRALPFVAAVQLAILSPLVIGGTDGRVADVLVADALWSLIAIVCTAVMAGVRRQRALLLAGHETAVDEARRDALTRLENRRSFDETIERALARAAATESPLTLAVGDLDAFKSVNDRHGHLVGDRCLQEVGVALLTARRLEDRVFRWGGDEFAVLIESASEAEADAVCARLEDEVAASVSTPDGRAVRITFGWAQDDGHGDAGGLVARADDALLARKRRASRQAA